MEKRFEDKKIPEGMLKDDGKQKDAAATAAGNFKVRPWDCGAQVLL